VPKITYTEANGVKHEKDVPVGYTVMQGAVQNGIPGILAECGGSCACGTCRVFVDAAWRERTGTASLAEESMLEVHEDAVAGQRLSCQMTVAPDWEGLIVHLPAKQF
jgi:ferredoxin, 2Fe-2S